jgi:hypothetical protein
VTTRKPPEAYSIIEDETMIGIVRCVAGDLATFARLAQPLLAEHGVVDDPGVWRIADPKWGWYRKNPDWTREFAWRLGTCSGPGPGCWQGAPIVVEHVKVEELPR